MVEHTVDPVEMAQNGSELSKEVQEEAMSSDEELELALPAVSGVSTPEEIPPISPAPEAPIEPLEPSIISSLATQSQSQSSLPQPSPFKPPQNPAIPQDLAVIAELVNSYQAVGSLPPLTITAAERRKQVEASIRARTEALQKDNAKAKAVEPETSTPIPEEPVVKLEEGMDQPRSLEEDAALRLELDRFVGAGAPAPDSDSSSDDSVSSSEFESDSEDEEEEGDEEFVFSNSPAPSPRKRPMTFEVIDDDEEPVSSEPIMSVNEAPLPTVPQPPFEKLPAGEGLTLAGEVVSWMKEKRVEAWWEGQNQAVAGPSGPTSVSTEETIEPKTKGDMDMEEGEVDEMAMVVAPVIIPKSTASTSTPKFTSSGTVVVRAMQQRPGQEGWLEEGSVVCHSDGSVLGFVSDTFGPLTSPFYSIRLPPPPFPLPPPEAVSIGTRLSYPLNPQYRSFVNMLAVQDPRFKGSDASNIHDEEVGEDEAEWSDDEMEAEAKKRKKNKRSDSRVSKGGRDRNQDTGYTITNHSLPSRPHFDYVPEDASDAASFYGGGGEEEGDEGDMVSVSDAGSSASRRPMPMPYDLDEAEAGASSTPIPVEADVGSNGNKRGRDQGRQRGAGRGGDRGRGGGGDRGRGGNGGRGGRGGGGGNRGGQGDIQLRRGGRGGNQSNHNPSPIRPTFGLPQRPQFDALSSLPTPPTSSQPILTPTIPQNLLSRQHVDGYRPPQKNQALPRPPKPYNPSPQQHYPQQQFNTYPSPQQQMYQPQQQQQQFQYPQQQQYPSYPPSQSYDHQTQMSNQQMGGGGDGPAINPLFAAQYQQMQFMSHLAAWQGQGQGQNPGDGGNGGGDHGQGGYGPPGGYPHQ